MREIRALTQKPFPTQTVIKTSYRPLMKFGVNADNNIQLVRGLNNDLDVDSVFPEYRKYGGADSRTPCHIPPDDRNERQISVYRDLRAERAFNLRKNGMYMLCRLLLGHDNTDDIHPGWDMLDVDSIFLKN